MPLEAGLGWAVKLGTNVPFLGREVLERQKAGPLAKRLACFTVNGAEVVLLGRETIYRDGARVGWLTGGGWGYTVERNIGYSYVQGADGVAREGLESGSYELEVAARRVPCVIRFGPLYDADNRRPRG